jgi:nitrogen regulatory protein PII
VIDDDNMQKGDLSYLKDKQSMMVFLQKKKQEIADNEEKVQAMRKLLIGEKDTGKLSSMQRQVEDIMKGIQVRKQEEEEVKVMIRKVIS